MAYQVVTCNTGWNWQKDRDGVLSYEQIIFMVAQYLMLDANTMWCHIYRYFMYSLFPGPILLRRLPRPLLAPLPPARVPQPRPGTNCIKIGRDCTVRRTGYDFGTGH